MKKSVIYLFLFLFAVVSAGAQKTFQGTVTYTYEVKGDNAEMMKSMMPQSMIIKYGDESMMTEMKGGMMASMMGKIIVNGKAGEAFVVQDAQKSIYVMKLDEQQAEQTNVKEVSKMDEQKEILGYDCQRYKMIMTQNGQEMTQYMWVTEELKAPEIKAPGLQQMGGAMASGKIPGFPMSTEVTIPGMNATMIMTVSDLNFDKVPANTFDRPEDYTVKDFEELMKMGGMRN